MASYRPHADANHLIFNSDHASIKQQALDSVHVSLLAGIVQREKRFFIHHVRVGICSKQNFCCSEKSSASSFMQHSLEVLKEESIGVISSRHELEVIKRSLSPECTPLQHQLHVSGIWWSCWGHFERPIWTKAAAIESSARCLESPSSDKRLLVSYHDQLWPNFLLCFVSNTMTLRDYPLGLDSSFWPCGRYQWLWGSSWHFDGVTQRL